MPILEDYKHFDGHHWETGCIYNFFDYRGLKAPHTGRPYSEALMLGVSGGIIPCPAALVVLLTALSMHRVGFGLVLIVAFSIGLAAVLVAIGVLMVYAGRLMTRFRDDSPWISRWLPLTSSAVMTLMGLGIAAQAVVPWMPR